MGQKEELEVRQGEAFHYDDRDQKALREILSDALQEGSYQIDAAQNLCVMPESYIGMIELPTRTIRITPRIQGVGMRQVQMMYFFVNCEPWDLVEANAIFDFTRGSLSESVARKFVQELSEVVQKGLPHLYQDRDLDLGYLKGQVQLEKTYENLSMSRSKPFRCHYEETSMNNHVSRILGAAKWF